MRKAWVPVLLLTALVVSGCGVTATKEDYGVKVDTAQLRDYKKQIGVEDCPTATESKVSGEQALPDLKLPCLGGGRDVELQRLRGPMLVSLWAQWCVNCPQELEWFQQASQEYAGKLQVLGIDWQDTQPGAALQLMAEKKATFPSLADPSGEFRNRGLPRLIMIDSAGKMVYDHSGELKDMATLRKLIEDHLGVTR
jgi:thiol-disulfide isomerase/thioredoxin